MRHTGQLSSIAEANDEARSLEAEAPSSRTVVRMATRNSEVTQDAEADGPISPWLYIGGLCVTLSGLYAVNFNLDDPTFAMLTYGLAICGYVTSYVLRVMRVSFQSLRLPLLIIVGLGLIAWLSSDRGMTGLSPHVDIEDRSKWLQLIFLWIAILHTFTLTTDASVLFACVPCMTMIALVSTASPDSEIQNAFIVFIAAATFLMVHENFLRTRTVSVSHPASSRNSRLFGGQVQLAFFCVVSALILANLVVIPIRTVGQSLLLANAFNPLTNPTKTPNIPNSNIFSNESRVVNLATGPVAESDTPVMRIQASRSASWRGLTYDFYTGTSFENHLSDTNRLTSTDEAAALRQMSSYQPPLDPNAPSDQWTKYNVPVIPGDLKPSEMQGGQPVTQTVTMLSDGIAQFYGAGIPLSISWPNQGGIVQNMAGSILASESFAVNAKYKMQSILPTDDTNRLRAATSDLNQFPLEIEQRYLQRPELGASNRNLRLLARSITANAPTNYDKAIAIQAYIAHNCKYNLQAPAAPAESDRVEYFLTVSKQGYCDSFAAAMTVLCRYAEIPARMVSGYLPGEPDGDTGTYLVRQKHKHLWTEVFFPNIGWVGFDATDGSEDISNHNLRVQQKGPNFLTWILSHGWLPPLATLCILSLLIYVLAAELLPRMRGAKSKGSALETMPAANRAIAQTYQQACLVLARRGLPRAPHLTPDEFASGAITILSPHQPQASEALQTLTRLHDRFRYGKAVADTQDAQQARASLQTLERALAQIPRRALSAGTT